MASADRADRIGIALVGAGRIAQSHLLALASQPQTFEPVAVVDSQFERAARAQSAFGFRHSFTSLDEALVLRDVDAVILCLPHLLHEHTAILALRAGKHVLVEKPMAHDAAAARRMLEASIAAGRVLAIGHTQRQRRAMRYLKEHLASLGRVISVEATFCIGFDQPAAAWWGEGGEGIIIPLNAPHLLDFLELTMQDLPETVYVLARQRNRNWDGEDEVMAVLGYPGNRMASLHLSANQTPRHDRRVVLCEGQVLEVETDGTLKVNGVVTVEPDPAEHSSRTTKGAVQFHRQLEEFGKAVRGRPSNCVLAEEGVRLMRVLDALRASARSGHAVKP